jgi:hypothetical protein
LTYKVLYSIINVVIKGENLMFKKAKLLAHVFTGKPETLVVDRKKFQLRSVTTHTAPHLLTETQDGWRAANEEELAEFAGVYKTGSIIEVHGVGESASSPLGKLTRVYKLVDGVPTQVDTNLVWGISPGKLILWVKA